LDYVSTRCNHNRIVYEQAWREEDDIESVLRLRCSYCHERIGKHQHLGHDLYVYQIAPGAMTVSNWTATP
jgi:hypothetical protein